LSDKEVRTTHGWDPENPDELPLDFAKHAGSFGRVRGIISTRNPTKGGLITLFDVFPEFSLARIAEQSQIVCIPSDKPGSIRFEVKASRIGLVVGLKIDLDAEHGHLIRRLMWKDGQVSEVEDFASFGDGIWVPMRIRGHGGKASSTLEVIQCQVNIPIPDKDLDFKFPEGARVDQAERGLIHLWGKDGPARSFGSDPDFVNYLEKYARGVQAANAGATVPSGFISSPLFWVANAVLVCLLGILVIVRRRIASRAS
jgi:hypothetical protein